MLFFKKQKQYFVQFVRFSYITKIFFSFFYNKKNIFYGGIELLSIKKDKNIFMYKNICMGDIFIVPINIHITKTFKLKIKIGERVLKGQSLTVGDKDIVPVHSPTSGIVKNIKKYILDQDTHKVGMGIVIIADGKDIWIPLLPVKNYKTLSSKRLISLIYERGIVGLGGGQFSTAHKLRTGIDKIDTLIINGVESDPYTRSDEWLMENYASDILKGCEILQWILKLNHIIIAISEEKLSAILNIKKELSKYPNFKITTIIKKYPSGSSKQLVQILTGKQIPHGRHATDLGILIYNVSTVYAIKKAIIEGHPLIERIITLTGDNAKYRGNMWVRIGTSIKDILLFTQGQISEDQRVIIGGPLTGTILSNMDIPILKSTSCLFITSIVQIKKQQNLEQPCIRCGICSNLCPMKLLPQQLYFYSKNSDHIKTKKYNIQDCIECGICEIVCPSAIPLMSYYKKEIRLLNEIHQYKLNVNIYKRRFHNKKIRLNNKERSLIKNIYIDNMYHIIKKDTDIIQKINDKNNCLDLQKKIRKSKIKDAIKRVMEKKSLNKSF